MFDVELLARRLGEVTEWLRAHPRHATCRSATSVPAPGQLPPCGPPQTLMPTSPPSSPAAAAPTSPDRSAPQVTAPTLLIVGGHDQAVPRPQPAGESPAPLREQPRHRPGCHPSLRGARHPAVAAELARDWFTDRMAGELRPDGATGRRPPSGSSVNLRIVSATPPVGRWYRGFRPVACRLGGGRRGATGTALSNSQTPISEPSRETHLLHTGTRSATSRCWGSCCMAALTTRSPVTTSGLDDKAVVHLGDSRCRPRRDLCDPILVEGVDMPGENRLCAACRDVDLSSVERRMARECPCNLLLHLRGNSAVLSP